MSTVSEINQLVHQVGGMKRGGQFRPFINFMQFPLYRSFQTDLRITFDFPLTVIVGQNGTGKTSLLHALAGAPRNTSPGNWWFGTAVDPLDAEDAPGRNLPSEYKAAFWYGYDDGDGQKKRAVKTRIRRAGDPDYWEPSRPIEAYGMGDRDDRHPVIPVRAYYLNFKTQINAFDRCFYFAGENKAVLRTVQKSRRWQELQGRIPRSRRRNPRIQDYLRIRSKRLRRVLVEGKTIKSAHGPLHKKRVVFDQEEIAEISRIIGRGYDFGALVEHKFYESWATSVFFKAAGLEYSEAFAGSGESAVARLVHKISSSNDSALFLLDEPETSLHPGAQQELLRYLLKKVREKRLQIVVSTHSPAFVRHLPREAVRVLTLDGHGTVTVASDVSADEAFYELGHPAENTIEIVVEDSLAQSLIVGVAQKIGSAFASQFSVTFRPGGESGMKQEAATTMLDQDRNVHFVFDGDKEDTCGPIEKAAVAIDTTADEVHKLLTDEVGIDLKFRQDSNMVDAAKRQLRVDYIDFVNSRFHCLPFHTPESVLWDDGTAKQLLQLFAPAKEFDSILAETDVKKRFDILTRAVRSTAEATDAADIRTVHEMFIARFCNEQGNEFQAVKALLEGLANA
jgi:predicted ATPase